MASEPIATKSDYSGSVPLGKAPGKSGRLTSNPYEPIYEWGGDGYDLGNPPIYTFFVSESPEGFGFGVNIEGDWREELYPDRESRDAAIDAAAFEQWKSNEEDWVEGISSVEELTPDLRGPCDMGMEIG